MKTEAFYDQYWTSGLHVGKGWVEQRFRKVFGPLIGRQRVLDYGCGLGQAYQRQLAASVGSYTGADVAPSALEDLGKKGLGGLKIDPSVSTIDSPSDAFDGAACIEVFEHLFDPLKAAREICRVLRPGGALVATVPNFGYHAWRLQALIRAQVPSEPERLQENRYNGVHIRFFSKLMLKRMMHDAGFANVTIGSFDHATIFDVFRALGAFAKISDLAVKHLPSPFHLRFLQDVCPNVFAMRLRAVGYKPQI